MENPNLLNKDFSLKPKKRPEPYIVRQSGTPCITTEDGKLRRRLKQESWLSQKNCKKNLIGGGFNPATEEQIQETYEYE